MQKGEQAYGAAPLPPPQQQTWYDNGTQPAPQQGYAVGRPTQAPTQQNMAVGVPTIWATAKSRQGDIGNRYANSWTVGAAGAPMETPCFCILAMLCPPCVSYHLRSRVLRGDLSQYVCCGGYLPCSGKCGEKDCPELCLCMETFCCFNMSVYVTRFLIQDELNIYNSKCDNCLIATMVFIHELRCICNILAFFRGEFRHIAHILRVIDQLVWCSVCACFQTQHKIQLDDRDGLRAPMASSENLIAAPQQQTMYYATSP